MANGNLVKRSTYSMLSFTTENSTRRYQLVAAHGDDKTGPRDETGERTVSASDAARHAWEHTFGTSFPAGPEGSTSGGEQDHRGGPDLSQAAEDKVWDI